MKPCELSFLISIGQASVPMGSGLEEATAEAFSECEEESKKNHSQWKKGINVPLMASPLRVFGTEFLNSPF
jgi:hypothetical protein